LTYYAIHGIVYYMVMGKTQSTTRESLSLELRRGALVLAVLTQLHGEEYGYSLKKLLVEKGLEIDEGTLYPLLRRLEGQGLLRSRWRVEDGRPRRYYRISPRGEALENELAGEWRSLADVIGRLLG
jgi:DNA-binding PadR family transcriptional regulator